MGNVSPLVIARGTQDMVMENDPLAVAAAESVTLIAAVAVPIMVGVPDITPDDAIDNPAGNAPPVVDQV